MEELVKEEIELHKDYIGKFINVYLDLYGKIF